MIRWAITQSLIWLAKKSCVSGDTYDSLCEAQKRETL
jgi:hypothetical protein